jgi:hypothetical protein
MQTTLLLVEYVCHGALWLLCASSLGYTVGHLLWDPHLRRLLLSRSGEVPALLGTAAFLVAAYVIGVGMVSVVYCEPARRRSRRIIALTLLKKYRRELFTFILPWFKETQHFEVWSHSPQKLTRIRDRYGLKRMEELLSRMRGYIIVHGGPGAQEDVQVNWALTRIAWWCHWPMILLAVSFAVNAAVSFGLWRWFVPGVAVTPGDCIEGALSAGVALLLGSAVWGLFMESKRRTEIMTEGVCREFIALVRPSLPVRRRGAGRRCVTKP